LVQLELLSRWLDREELAVDELTPERAEEFVRARRAAGYRSWVSPLSLRVPLQYLRGIGVAPEAMAPEGPVERLLEDYHCYLLRERGLAEATFVRFKRDARLFLSWRLGPGGLELTELTAADVSEFLARECPRRSVSGARYLVTVMRSLLRYLYVVELIGLPLQWAVPGVADLRDRSLPRGVEPAAVAKLLAACDRRRRVGRRDYAILLLLVRLGLRAGEVAALRLDDVDWRQGEVLIRGKGNRHELLPLPADVGDALVSYLRRRQRCECRAMFLTVLAPIGALRPTAVGFVVHDACVRAGIAPFGPHRLRHTAATGMLRAGASLEEIAEVLRHRQLKATAIYAKVDRTALRALCQPWPGGVS
jgi:site-specific recombinase XerD